MRFNWIRASEHRTPLIGDCLRYEGPYITMPRISCPHPQFDRVCSCVPLINRGHAIEAELLRNGWSRAGPQHAPLGVCIHGNSASVRWAAVYENVSLEGSILAACRQIYEGGLNCGRSTLPICRSICDVSRLHCMLLLFASATDEFNRSNPF